MSDPAAEIGTDEDVRLVDEAVRRALVIPQIQAAAAALGEELLGYPVPMIGVREHQFRPCSPITVEVSPSEGEGSRFESEQGYH